MGVNNLLHSFQGPEALKPALNVINAQGIKEIDTAQMYGTNETDLGEAGAAAMGFAVSTKNYGGWKKGVALTRDDMLKTTKESLQKLRVDQVDIFHIHGPDRSLQYDECVSTVHELFEKGVFKRFGVSNFSPDEVRELHDYCTSKGYVLPTVYQGNYNAVSRNIDTTLFPLLRERGIAFYAYSPIAGDFLIKSRKALEEGTEAGRFAAGTSDSLKEMYRGLYVKPSMLAALDKWEALAKDEGVSKAELAYRWVYCHSSLKPEQGDDILGASKIEQIVSSVGG
ncbi:NADP-dependent oxidoreductase domain-containing protein [Pseudomassariella vexata]|uniref:NADP-dependent oxidoreductase domain-containing protein n=1 Tax=Pseudomassariella vexata TaxID=1141098 RepID=A0A1Y2DT86_9PEZI|nr:NADP-dependent oxidoreductase domain-containing protein [Pseudomassariella vexata]ORY62483.1 NADP-dependent oxidoreductase domain-containing protein [Pseudomassariella vexata]